MSIMCRACRRANDPCRRFCGGCGSNLPGGCAHCGCVNRTDDKVCGGCARAQRTMPSTLPSMFKEQQQQETTPLDISDVIPRPEQEQRDDERHQDRGAGRRGLRRAAARAATCFARSARR